MILHPLIPFQISQFQLKISFLASLAFFQKSIFGNRYIPLLHHHNSIRLQSHRNPLFLRQSVFQLGMTGHYHNSEKRFFLTASSGFRKANFVFSVPKAQMCSFKNILILGALSGIFCYWKLFC